VPSKTAKKTPAKRWSKHVTETSNALDLDRGVFSWKDPKRIARSLKRSAETSKRRKSSPAQSAMSMLNFYINRAGQNLSAQQKRVLERAKDELHRLFEASGGGARGRTPTESPTRKKKAPRKSPGARSKGGRTEKS
jgi:hypothetical protein